MEMILLIPSLLLMHFVMSHPFLRSSEPFMCVYDDFLVLKWTRKRTTKRKDHPFLTFDALLDV